MSLSCLCKQLRLASHLTNLKSSRLTNLKNARSLSYSVQRCARQELPISWTHEEKLRLCDPQFTGDREAMKVDLSQPRPDVMCAEERLQECDEKTRRLLTIQYMPVRERSKVYEEELISRVRRHKLDTDSKEVQIAQLSSAIRFKLEGIEKTKGRVRGLKRILISLLGRRRDLLDRLRDEDYQRFEFVLDKLNIVYNVSRPDIPIMTRKEAMRTLTNEYTDKIRNDKIKKLKEELAPLQEAFLKEKEETMRWIHKEEKELGLRSTTP